jgi:O-antigen ligase
VQLLITGAGLLLLALLTLSPNGATRMFQWPWWAGLRILILLPFVALAATALLRPRTARPSTLLAALLGGFAAIHVLSAASSAHPAESLAAAILPVATAALAWRLASLRAGDERAAGRLALVLAAGGAVFTAMSLGQWIVGSALPMIERIGTLNATAGADVFHLNPHGFRNDRPLGHSNYTAGVALLALPWMGAMAWRTRKTVRIGWIAAALLCFAVLLSSGSRGAIIGLAGGAAFGVLLAAVALRWSWKRMTAAGAVLLLLLVLLVAAIPRVRNSVLEAMAGNQPNIGDQQRLAMLRIGADMGAERWWIGQGPGLVTRLYPTYRERVDGGVDAAFQLHCAPVQVWAETGLPGLALAAAILGLALLSSVRGVRAPAAAAAPGKTVWCVAAGLSLAAYATFALTDYQLDIPVVAAAMAANLAIVATAVPLAAERRSLAAPVLGAVALVGGVWLTLPEARARQIFASAVADLEHGGDLAEFDARVVAAAKLQPDCPHYFAGGAAAHLRLGQSAEDSAARGRHLAMARAFLERALAVEPNNEFAHFNLGWLVLNSDPGRAVVHFRVAQRLLADHGGVYLGLGLARLDTGDVARGRDALALEILNDPAFLTAPTWDTPALAPHRETVVQRAIAISAEFLDRAGARPPPQLAYVHHLLRWWTGDDRAADEFEERAPAVAAAPPGPTVVGPDTPGWLVLRDAATLKGDARRKLLARFLFARTEKPADPAQLAVLDRLVDRCGTDWRAWLQAPEGRDAPFVKIYRRNRVPYPILARNMDIPVAHDAYLIQENLLASLFFDFVFPERGYLPDAFLLNYVAARDL